MQVDAGPVPEIAGVGTYGVRLTVPAVCTRALALSSRRVSLR